MRFSREIFPVIDADTRTGCTAAAFETPARVFSWTIALLIKYYITALYKKRGRPMGMGADGRTRERASREEWKNGGDGGVWFEAGSNKPQIRATVARLLPSRGRKRGWNGEMSSRWKGLQDGVGEKQRVRERERLNSGRYIVTKTKLTECQNFFVIKFFTALAVMLAGEDMEERGDGEEKGDEVAEGFAPSMHPRRFFVRGVCV